MTQLKTTVMMGNADKMIAVGEVEKWGCPYCGFRSSTQSLRTGGASLCRCSECEHSFIALAYDVDVSPFGCGTENGETFYPRKQMVHPRKGTPSHGSPDISPPEGGEFFRSRGIGTEYLTCFVCGVSSAPNISAFVQCKAAGDRIAQMFDHPVKVDYRDYEPDYVQVKVGACTDHRPALEQLRDITSDGRITRERVYSCSSGGGLT